MDGVSQLPMTRIATIGPIIGSHLDLLSHDRVMGQRNALGVVEAARSAQLYRSSSPSYFAREDIRLERVSTRQMTW